MNKLTDIKQGGIEQDDIVLIAGFIASAMDTEDEVLEGPYEEYLRRDQWPSNLPEDAYNSIVKLISLLLDDTRKHKRMLLTLQERLSSHD